MEPVSRLYLDTNILILLAEGTGEISDLLYQLIGQQAPDQKPFCCTSDLTLAELLIKPYRERNETLIQLYDNWIQRENAWLDVGPVSRDAVYFAAVLRSDYPSIKLPDAIHLSIAIGFECSHFMTADSRLPDEIELWHQRHGYTRGPVKLTMLPPEPGILKNIIQTRSGS